MNKYLYPLFIGIIAFGIAWLNRHHFFFWDTVQLTSLHAHWFYENNFSNFFLPENLDSGHPPFWGIYHALNWKIFGKSMLVSHLSMVPFIFGSLFFAGKIGVVLTQQEESKWFFGLFLLADPVFLTQSSIVSPDIALSCFFLMVLYGLLHKSSNQWLIVIGSIGLSLISLRGMMTLAGFGFFILFQLGFKQGFRKILPLFPGVFVGLGFLITHSLQTKWIGYHADSPWAESFQMAGAKGFWKNVAVLIWRFMDVGRVYIWILLVAILFRIKKPSIDYPKLWGHLFLAFSIVLLPTFLLYKGLNGMRYLMPLFLILNLLFLQSIFSLRKHGYKKWKLVYFVGFFVFLSGHTWQNPPNLAVSWDTTLRHLPYYSLRNELLSYMEHTQIPISETATAFPNTATLETIDLNENAERMLPMDSPKAKYYFLSNIFNDVSASERALIESKGILLKKLSKNGIHVSLWKKRDVRH